VTAEKTAGIGADDRAQPVTHRLFPGTSRLTKGRQPGPGSGSPNRRSASHRRLPRPTPAPHRRRTRSPRGVARDTAPVAHSPCPNSLTLSMPYDPRSTTDVLSRHKAEGRSEKRRCRRLHPLADVAERTDLGGPPQDCRYSCPFGRALVQANGQTSVGCRPAGGRSVPFLNERRGSARDTGAPAPPSRAGEPTGSGSLPAKSGGTSIFRPAISARLAGRRPRPPRLLPCWAGLAASR
jgi:hypothetical protein